MVPDSAENPAIVGCATLSRLQEGKWNGGTRLERLNNDAAPTGCWMTKKGWGVHSCKSFETLKGAADFINNEDKFGYYCKNKNVNGNFKPASRSDTVHEHDNFSSTGSELESP